MLNPSKEQEAAWAEHRRYCHARFCWVNRHKEVVKNNGKRTTWELSFIDREGMTLQAYAQFREKTPFILKDIHPKQYNLRADK